MTFVLIQSPRVVAQAQLNMMCPAGSKPPEDGVENSMFGFGYTVTGDI